MSTYIENPKTKDSGIVCCIPQRGRCPSGSEGLSTKCRHCGNCLREYYATVERMMG